MLVSYFFTDPSIFLSIKWSNSYNYCVGILQRLAVADTVNDLAFLMLILWEVLEIFCDTMSKCPPSFFVTNGDLSKTQKYSSKDGYLAHDLRVSHLLIVVPVFLLLHQKRKEFSEMVGNLWLS